MTIWSKEIGSNSDHAMTSSATSTSRPISELLGKVDSIQTSLKLLFLPYSNDRMSSLYSALEMVDRGSNLLYFTQRVLREPCTDFDKLYCKINIYFDEKKIEKKWKSI